jgi:hypothetical protein
MFHVEQVSKSVSRGTLLLIGVKCKVKGNASIRKLNSILLLGHLSANFVGIIKIVGDIRLSAF